MNKRSYQTRNNVNLSQQISEIWPDPAKYYVASWLGTKIKMFREKPNSFLTYTFN